VDGWRRWHCIYFGERRGAHCMIAVMHQS